MKADPPHRRTVSAYVGAKIRREMRSRRVSQRDVAAELKIAQSVLARKLAGIVMISVSQLVDIAEILDMEPEDLLEGAPRTDQWMQASIDSVHELILDQMAYCRLTHAAAMEHEQLLVLDTDEDGHHEQ